MNQWRTEFSQRGKDEGTGREMDGGREEGHKRSGEEREGEERERDLRDHWLIWEHLREAEKTHTLVAVAGIPSCHYCATSDGISSLEICVKFQLRTSSISQGNISLRAFLSYTFSLVSIDSRSCWTFIIFSILVMH